mmetsp:Transcript_2863/g.10117  ORF Transcript_2863/g.10117 Transcript_2863/m.10117 type:complete len:209 (-) Transcript_2863:393-1019(-)
MPSPRPKTDCALPRNAASLVPAATRRPARASCSPACAYSPAAQSLAATDSSDVTSTPSMNSLSAASTWVSCCTLLPALKVLCTTSDAPRRPQSESSAPTSPMAERSCVPASCRRPDCADDRARLRLFHVLLRSEAQLLTLAPLMSPAQSATSSSASCSLPFLAHTSRAAPASALPASEYLPAAQSSEACATLDVMSCASSVSLSASAA